jgi:HTH-type transcriptional regulator / antitoxin HigA
MITNERQYKIGKTELEKLRETIKQFDLAEAAKALNGDRPLAKAQLEALQSESEVISEQLREYESLKTGSVRNLEAGSLSELPGLLIKARIALGLSQRQLAERMRLKEQQIQRYESENYASASLSRLIEISDALGLRVAEKARLEALGDGTRRASGRTLDWTRFPVKEMYRRGWFGGFTGSSREAEANSNLLVASFLKDVFRQPLQALHKKQVRSGSNLDQYSLLAWECRVLKLAVSEHITVRFRKSEITSEWMGGLAKLSSQSNGPRKAKDYLKDSGIALVVEPHLPQTYLDGAVMLLKGATPVIGMTLRYDRLDNFWFVLFHELGHLALHLGSGDNDQFFDDLEADADGLESEADRFASEAVMPSEAWETSVARYVRTAESVKALAHDLGVSPALIAGRIRKESDNYMILTELVGAGEVRKQFLDVRFGQ